MRKFAFLGAIALAGCGSQNQYIRADGQSISAQQLEADRAACASQSDDNYCMVERGYFLFAADQAAAKQTQLAAIAEEHRKQAELAAQAAAEAHRRAAAEARKHAAAKRKKPQPAAQQSQGAVPGSFRPAAQQSQGAVPGSFRPAAQQSQGAVPGSAVRPAVGAFVR